MTLSNGPTLGIEPTAYCWFAVMPQHLILVVKKKSVFLPWEVKNSTNRQRDHLVTWLQTKNKNVYLER